MANLNQAPLQSCLYVGRVRHRRYAPIENGFTYSGFWMYLDLSELDRVFEGRWLWSTSRPALARFCREDHLVYPEDLTGTAEGSGEHGDPTTAAYTAARRIAVNRRTNEGSMPAFSREHDAFGLPLNDALAGPARQRSRSFGKRPVRPLSELPSLDESIRCLVADATGRQLEGPIRLLTQLRYFGYVINPVSFFYCFDPSGSRVEAVVAEVNNTPWGERHCYVLNCIDDTSEVAQVVQTDPAEESRTPNESRRLRFEHVKRFHVSPFMDLDMEYRWSLVSPGQTVSVHIENWRQSELLFDGTLHLQRRPISPPELARILVLHPFMTGKFTTAIYWQALRLWWKRCPFVSHPNGEITSS